MKTEDVPRIASIKTDPCSVCETPNRVCARPPGAVAVNDENRCSGCGHPPTCHVW